MCVTIRHREVSKNLFLVLLKPVWLVFKDEGLLIILPCPLIINFHLFLYYHNCIILPTFILRVSKLLSWIHNLSWEKVYLEFYINYLYIRFPSCYGEILSYLVNVLVIISYGCVGYRFLDRAIVVHLYLSSCLLIK